MSFFEDLLKDITVGFGVGGGLTEGAGRVGAAAGTYSGTQGTDEQKARAAGHALEVPAPVKPGEAIKQTAQSALGLGPVAPNLRNFWVWVIIVLVGLIGVWGLLAPGGGVAVIERVRR